MSCEPSSMSITSISAMFCANTFAPSSPMLLLCVPANGSSLTFAVPQTINRPSG